MKFFHVLNYCFFEFSLNFVELAAGPGKPVGEETGCFF